MFRWTIIKALSITVGGTNKNNKKTGSKIFIVEAIQSKPSRINIIGLISFKTIIVEN